MTAATTGYLTEPADETTPRGSAPGIPDYHGDDDYEGEASLQALLSAPARAEGAQR